MRTELLERDGLTTLGWYRAEDSLLFRAEVRLLRRELPDVDSLIWIYTRRQQWHSFLARSRHAARAAKSRAFASWCAAHAVAQATVACSQYHAFKRQRRSRRAAVCAQPDIEG